MTVSSWKRIGFEEKILRILDIQPYEGDHHFGRPFLTLYQIAILFKNMFPEEFARFNEPLGGKGTGLHHSLSQYIARSLSGRIKKGLIKNIEGRFLYMSHIKTIQYSDFGETFDSSDLTYLSMYRRMD